MLVVNSCSVFWWRSEKDSTFFSTPNTKPENSGLLVKEVVIIASTDRGSQSVRADENHLVVEKTATTLEIYYTWQDVDDDGDSFWHLFSCTVETMVATNFSTNLSVGRHQLPSTCNLLSCTTQTLPSYLHHVWSFSNGLRTGLVGWMMNTLKETIYDDETLTLLLCLLSWASRTRLGWNRRANAENGIIVTSFTDITSDEQVLTTCCECWEWHFHDIMRSEIWMRRLFWLRRQALPSYIYNCNTCSWLGGCSRQFISVLKVFCRWSE